MKHRKRSLPAFGAILLLLLAMLSATHPAWGAEPRQGRVPLKYFWPTFIPPAHVIQPAESFASETLFMLRLQQQGGQFDTTISGGAAGEPPARGGRPVTVRGQPGMAYSTGAIFTIIWTEQGQVYAIAGGLGLQSTLAIANGFEEVDLATFRRRLAGVATRPSIYYANAGRVFEIRADGSTIRHGNLAALGGAIDAVDYGLRTLVLSHKGLQSVVPREGAGVIARFQAGDAQFGRLIGTADNSYVVYQYVRDDKDSTTGFASVIGVVDGRTLRARKIYGNPTGQSTAVGLSADGRGVYIVDWGQDPAFGEVKLISISDGKVMRRVVVDGYAFAVQSPDRRTLVTMNVAANSLMLYDLAAPRQNPHVIVPVKRGAMIRNMIWSPDSRYIYIPVGANDLPDGPSELWRVEVATNRLALVAKGIPAPSALLGTDVTGRWLLHRDGGSLNALDLTTGRVTRVSIPAEAVVFRWR